VKKCLGISLALGIASLAVQVGAAGTASAGVLDCPDTGVACAYIDKNYGGKPIWQESSPGSYSFSGSFRKTTSIINRTSYTIRLAGEVSQLGICLIRGHSIRELPKGYNDQLRSIEVNPSPEFLKEFPCTETR
jgi:hypothetical protein